MKMLIIFKENIDLIIGLFKKATNYPKNTKTNQETPTPYYGGSRLVISLSLAFLFAILVSLNRSLKVWSKKYFIQ